MSTLNEIYFNYNKAMDQAQELDNISKRLKTAANNTMEGILNDVRVAWKSDSTPQYIKKRPEGRGRHPHDGQQSHQHRAGHSHYCPADQRRGTHGMEDCK